MEPHIVADLLDLPFHENVDYLVTSHIIEHFTDNDAIACIKSIWRALKPGGKWECVVPHAMTFDAFQDPDHKSYWVQTKFLYFTPHFDFLHRSYENRFQLRKCDLVGSEVRAVLQKIATLESCECSMCMKESDNGQR